MRPLEPRSRTTCRFAHIELINQINRGERGLTVNVVPNRYRVENRYRRLDDLAVPGALVALRAHQTQDLVPCSRRRDRYSVLHNDYSTTAHRFLGGFQNTGHYQLPCDLVRIIARPESFITRIC